MGTFIDALVSEPNIQHKINKIITKQSRVSEKAYTNNIYKNELVIYGIINIILFSLLFYLMIKNK
tara:strand:+ start:2190 stop:2384 length:195 start_codon:yes stop_codon:yes gene_type:complete